MFSATPITESLPAMRREYRMLRELMDPQTACDQLARSYQCELDQARWLIGTLSETRICRNCWTEYVHLRNDSRHLCDECLSEEHALQNAQYQEELRWQRLYPPKFDDEEETVGRTIIMLTVEYGMNREEALQYISDIQFDDAIIPKTIFDGENIHL